MNGFKAGLGAAWRETRHEWAVRPTGHAVLSHVVLPGVFILFYALVAIGQPIQIIALTCLYLMGWFGRGLWLSSGKVQMYVREVQCACGARARSSCRHETEVLQAQHLREVHHVEVTPEQVREHFDREEGQR